MRSLARIIILHAVMLSVYTIADAAGGYSSHDAHQCKVAINYYEKKYNIPKNLLHSIAIVESGRWDNRAMDYYPWPWAVGVEGKPYYFDNKHQAVNFVRDQLRKGKRNIDVGCNQINLYHHGKHFSSLEQAFNPVANTNYAAKFLKSHFDNTNSWVSAVARYHSHTAALGREYALNVFSKWKTFVKGILSNDLNNQGARDSRPMLEDTELGDYKSRQMRHDAKARVKGKHGGRKSIRAKEGIIIFSRDGSVHVDGGRVENQAITAISKRVLKSF